MFIRLFRLRNRLDCSEALESFVDEASLKSSGQGGSSKVGARSFAPRATSFVDDFSGD
jgi:hypothetical protein